MPGPKPRTIKFHEYKGPDTSQKRKSDAGKTKQETTYDLAVEQQQLFLQWQLQNQAKVENVSIRSQSTKSTNSFLTEVQAFTR